MERASRSISFAGLSGLPGLSDLIAPGLSIFSLNKNGNDLVDKERLDKTIKSGMRTFSKVFPLVYKYLIVDEMMKREKSVILDAYELQKAPVPSAIIKSGFLYKKGAVVKSWKRRWFCALNEQDNFMISYSAGVDQKTSEIARFSCCGYNVTTFTAEETESYGDFGIKLEPIDGSKRYWWFRAENADQQIMWMSIFANACRRAKPNTDDNPLIAAAFRRAYMETRVSYGFYGSQDKFSGDEVNMLELLMRDLLFRETLETVFSQLQSKATSNVVYFQAVREVNVIVDRAIRPFIGDSWRFLRDSVLKQHNEFTNDISIKLRNIAEYEQKVMRFFVNDVKTICDAVLEDFEHKVMIELSRLCASAIMDAYEMALRAIFIELSKRLYPLMHEPSSAQAQLTALMNSITGFSPDDTPEQDILFACKEILSVLTSSSLASVSDNFIGSMTPAEILNRILDNLIQIIRNVVYSFAVCIRVKGVTNELIRLLSDTLRHMCHDMAAQMKESFYGVLQELAESCIQDGIVLPSHDIFKNAVRRANIPMELREYVLPHFVGDFYVRNYVNTFLYSSVEETFAPALPRLLDVTNQLNETLSLR